MSNPSDEFFNSIDYPSIIDNIKGIYTSDGSMSTLLDFERVLDEADLYAFQNWELGELVSGPNIKRYTVDCVFMYPRKLMPNPKGAKRLLTVGCNIKFKKTTLKVPVKIESQFDYKPGTHYPKMVDREVWLVMIEMPKELMNDIREGSIELAGKDIDLDDLDSAYDDDLDKQESGEEDGAEQGQDMGMGQMPMAQSMGGMGGAPMPPGGGMM
jgi:hypothetical protein